MGKSAIWNQTVKIADEDTVEAINQLNAVGILSDKEGAECIREALTISTLTENYDCPNCGQMLTPYRFDNEEEEFDFLMPYKWYCHRCQMTVKISK